jgi:hypothetical protein
MNEHLKTPRLLEYGTELLGRIQMALPHLYDGLEKQAFAQAVFLFDTLKSRRAVERGILAFVERAALLKWQPAEYKCRLVQEFRRLVREHFSVYEQPTTCADCDEYCSAEFCYICLSRDFELYGCVRHASVHECVKPSVRHNGQVMHEARSCPCTIIDAQTDEVCVFSGNIVGKHLMTSAGASKDFSSDDAHIRSQAGFQFRLSMIEHEAMVGHFRNRDTKTPYHPIMDYIFDDDDDDDDACATADKKAASKKRVRFADTGAETSTRDGGAGIKAVAAAAAPRLSKQKRARLNENNYFEFRKTQIIEEAERYLRSIADDVINHLLFDGDVRRLLNEEQIFRVSGEMVHSLGQYHAAKKRAFEMPVWTECLAAFFTPQTKLRLLRIVDYDREQIAKFCELAVTRWRLCFRSPAFINKSAEPCAFKKFALALLFCMRSGLSIPPRGAVWSECNSRDRIVVVPRDETLSVDLPDENLLRFFGAEAREVLRETLAKGSTISVAAQQQQPQNAKHSHARGPRIERVPQRIEINGIGAVMCRSFMPTHLYEEFLGDTSSYAPSDITVGLEFLKTCVGSFSEESRQILKFS